jgi:hypothetical protein
VRLLTGLSSLIIAISTAHQVRAWTYDAYVYDGDSQVPIANCSVVSDSGGVAAITDLTGWFCLNVRELESYRFGLRIIGYRDTLLTVYRSNRFSSPGPDTILLEISPLEVDGMVITGQSSFRLSDWEDASIRLKANAIDISPLAPYDPLRAISRLPGIQVPTDLRSDVIVRGGNPSECSFTIDGHPVINAYHYGTQGSSGGFSSLIPPDAIERIRFSPGGFSVKYPNSISASLDLKSIGELKKQGGFCRADLLGVTAGAMIGDDDRSVLASVRRSYFDAVQDQLNVPSVPTYADVLVKSRLPVDDNVRLEIITVGATDKFAVEYGDLPYDYGGLDYAGKSLLLAGSTRMLLDRDKSVEFKLSYDLTEYDISSGERGIPDLYRNKSSEHAARFSVDYSTDAIAGTEVSTGLSQDLYDCDFDINIVSYLDDEGNSRPGMELETDLEFAEVHTYAEIRVPMPFKLEVRPGIRLD